MALTAVARESPAEYNMGTNYPVRRGSTLGVLRARSG